ncbi:MAG TPA: hypothetical protein HPP94_03535 [Desulfuromonadales bacterium]|nr:hypothetical protein [Desulfuromonadales bacterium]
MCECGSSKTAGVGPFATGRSLVEFVLNAHGGSVAVSKLPHSLDHTCQGCGVPFVQETFVQTCPACGGVHAISPPRAGDADAIQFAGSDFVMP